MKTKLFFILLAFLAAGCLDDKTNYDFTLVNEVKKVENIEGSYTLYPGQSQLIEPVVHYTLDSIHPDVSYEWYVDMELVGTESTYNFVADEIGKYTLTFVVVDNIHKLKFADYTYINVDSEWKKGWLILSDNNNNSELSIVKTQTIEVKGADGYNRDSLLIVGMDRNLNPGLGTGPIKLFEHFANDDYAVIAQEIVVVQKNKCIELNGYSLQREIYTEEEFADGVPAGFEPKDVAMSYKGNVVLDKSGYIYHSASVNGTAFHTGRYSSTPYQNGKKFCQVATGRGGKADYIIVVEEHEDHTHSIGAIVDQGVVRSGGDGGFGTTHVYNGHYATMPEDGSAEAAMFNRIPADFLCTAWSGKDPSYGDPMFLSVLKENGSYYFFNFQVDVSKMNAGNGAYKFQLDPYLYEKTKAPDEAFADFRDIAVFPYRDYVIVASGNSLYAVNYKESAPAARLLMTLPAAVTTLGVRDFDDYYKEYEGPQLGVGLENGEFYVFQVDNDTEALKEVYHETGLGRIVDVIYKYCSYSKFYEGKYY